MKFYAGIGSRSTPENVLRSMAILAKIFSGLGYTLRSGGAEGADSAFESGAGLNKQIFLPWKEFNGNQSKFYTPSSEAELISRHLHPHWGGISRGARLLNIRNVHQIAGPEVGTSPLSEFVICWTPNGRVVGGTGRAIKIAEFYDVPVYNLANMADAVKLQMLIEDIKLGE